MIRCCFNKTEKSNCPLLDKFTLEKANEVRDYHRKIEEYNVTRLVSLDAIAENTGVGRIFLKDESSRFDLNAFKVLGGSYAVGKVLEKEKSIDTVITATDGNHGRGVAWSARKFGLKSIVYMPKGTAKERLDNILALGADASITELSYDEAVDKAERDAKEKGYALVQDTSWEGYEEIPTIIMQGYLTMALEASEQLEGIKPTHVFLQAGVGSMAASVAAFFTNLFPDSKPFITVVEPEKANCLYLTAEADDGKIHEYTDDMDTMMAGLACGRPCTVAWEILKNCTDLFVSIDDDSDAEAMRILAENGVVSGESGAASLAAFLEMSRNPDLCDRAGINENSVILFFSTEGATDRENYEKVISV